MGEQKREQPVIIVTGASGFVGHYFIEEAKEKYTIYALARRSQKESEVSDHPNIHWMRVDIGEEEEVSRAMQKIAKRQRSIDFVFHFACYYDFTYKNVPEYERTNVVGTKNLLKCLEPLSPQRFIFSSSLAVTDFSDPNRIIDEKSPADADYPYANSKRKAEELVRQYADRFPCTILRLAAIYSDWCEYGPLYVILNSWLQIGWKSKIIVGRGKTALPYLHVADLNSCLFKIVAKHSQLENCNTLVASPNGCISHNRLFDHAQRYCYGTTIYPRYVPVVLASIGVILTNIFGKIFHASPFEKLWMMRYIDQRMDVDASKTFEQLDWQPKARYDLKRRLLFLVENMKTNPLLWKQKNIAMAHKKEEVRPGLKIYNAMLSVKEDLIREHVAHISLPENSNKYPHYQKLKKEVLTKRVRRMHEMLEIAILNGHRSHIFNYSRALAEKRFKEGFSLEELIRSLSRGAAKIEEALRYHPELVSMQQKVRDEIVITMQLVVDEVEDVYENLLVTRQAGEG